MKNRLFLNILSKFVALALVITTYDTCFFILHQPEFPEEARNFKFGRK